MTQQVWALLAANDYCVGEYIGEDAPSAADTSTPFVAAVRVARRGDMMIEDIVVDHDAGTGRWVEHQAAKAHSDLLARLNAMDPVELFRFTVAAAVDAAKASA